MTDSARDRILSAATRIVQRDGVARLTIEAVAREAGLSKGGVLYHFPTKEALIAGMVATLLREFDASISQALVGEEGAGRWVRAYLRASSQIDEVEAGAVGSLLAALATDPHSLEPARKQYGRWQQQLEHDGLPPILATLLRLAADGLWFADLFGLAPPRGRLRAEVIENLLAMAQREDGDDLPGAGDPL